MQSALALKPYSHQSTDKDGVADGCRVAELDHTLVRWGRLQTRRHRVQTDVSLVRSMCRAPTQPGYSQFSAPPVWYSVTRVSKKLRSFFRSIISLIHGNGFSS
jgi:hypothetical protein